MSITITTIFIPGIYKTHSYESNVKSSIKVSEHMINMYRKCIVKCTHKACKQCIDEYDILHTIIESVDEDGNILDKNLTINDYAKTKQFTMYIYQKEYKPIIPIECTFIYRDTPYNFKYMYMGEYTLRECCEDYLEYKCRQLVQIKKCDLFAVKYFHWRDYIDEIIDDSEDDSGGVTQNINLILSFIDSKTADDTKYKDYTIRGLKKQTKIKLSTTPVKPIETIISTVSQKTDFETDSDNFLENLFLTNASFEVLIEYYKMKNINFPLYQFTITSEKIDIPPTESQLKYKKKRKRKKK